MILIDINQNAKHPNHLKVLNRKKGIIAKTAFLKVGDYQIGDSVIVEAKEVSDFIASIKDNRLWEQADNLTQVEHPILAIIGKNIWKPFYFSKSRNVHNVFYGALASIAIKFRIPVVFFNDEDDFLNFLAVIDRKLSKGAKSIRPAPIFRKPKTLRERQENCLTAIEGIGIETASKLLDCFGSIKNIANSNEAELQMVEGIGKKTAKNILKVLANKIEEEDDGN